MQTITRKFRRAAWVLCALGACGAIAAWASGRVCSDRWLWTQFLWWIPSLWIVLASGTLSILTVLLGRSLARETIARGQRASRALGLGVWCLVATGAITAWWLAAELKLHRAVFASPAVASDCSLTLLTWNPSVTSLSHLAQRVEHEHPDVLLLANIPFNEPLDSLTPVLGTQISTARTWRLSIASRWRILRWGSTPLRVTGAKPRTFVWKGGGMVSIDAGEAIIAEIDTRERTGSTTLVWFIDLPSDPHIPRSRMMREARAALDAFDGPWLESGPPGLMVHVARFSPLQQENPAGETPPKYRPDIIAGDCNTPGGSASLDMLWGDTVDCYASVGWGGRASFPASTPLLAIDHTAIAQSWTCTKYAVVDLGAGKHRAQVAHLQPRDGPAK